MGGAAAVRGAAPPARWEDRESIPVTPFDMRTSPWWEAYRVAATDKDLALEEPEAYHRAFPANPVPGRAIAVLRGTGADGGVFRLAFHTARQEMAERGAVLFASPPGRVGVQEPRLTSLGDVVRRRGSGRRVLGPSLDAHRHRRRQRHAGSAGRPLPGELSAPTAGSSGARAEPCAR